MEVQWDGQHFGVALNGARTVVGDRLLAATGRRADLRSLGVAESASTRGCRGTAVDNRLHAGPGVWDLYISDWW